MSGPKKTSVFDFLNQRIEANKAKSGYGNIIQPFNTDDVTQLDNEELKSNEGQDNVSAEVLDYLKISSGERKAMSFAQSEAAKVAEAEDKKIFDETANNIKTIDDELSALQKDKSNFTLDQPKPEVAERMKQLAEQKRQLALSTQGNMELQKINDKIKALEDPYKWDGAKTDTGFFSNPLKWADETVSNLFANAHNTFSDPESNMKPQEKAEYQMLKKQRDTFYKPIAEQKILEREENINNLQALLYGSDEAGANYSKAYNDKIDAFRKSTLGDKIETASILMKLQESKRELEAYVNGEDGGDAFFRKLGRETVRVNEGGNVEMVTPWVNNITDFIFKDDLQKRASKNGYEALSAKDKILLQHYSEIEEDQQFLGDKQKWSYGMVDGTMNSVGFIRDMYVGSKVIGMGGAALGLEGSALAGSTSVLRATGNKFLARAAATGIKGSSLAASYAIQNQLNPQFINQELMKGSHIERDENGSITNIYVKDKLFDYMKDVYDQTAKVYTAEKNKLEAKGSLSEADQERLAFLKIKLGEDVSGLDNTVTEMKELSLQEELATFKPSSLMEAEVKGFVNTSIENLTELYTGKAFGLLGKGLSKVPGVNKFTTKLISKADDMAASFNSSKLGRLYKNWNNGVGKLNVNGAKVIGSMPEEVLEEYVAGALHSAVNADPKEFIDMFDTQANIDIAAQTLLMSAGFGLMGNAQTHTKLAYNNLINKRLAELAPKAEAAVARIPQIDTLIKQHQATLDTTDKGTPEHSKALAEIDTLNSEKAEAQKVLDKQESFKSNPSLTGLGIVNRLPGITDSTFSATRNYIDSRNEIRKRLDTLKLADTDAKVNSLLNLSSLEGFGVSDQKLRVESLRTEGKNEEADLIEKSMFQNIVLQSFRSNTQDELKKALQRVQKRTDLLPETLIQVQKANEQLEALGKIYEYNKDKPNVQNIMTLALEKFSAKEGIEKIEADKAKIAESVREEINAFIEGNKLDVDYSLETLFTRQFNDQAEQDKYDKFLEKLSNHRNTMIDNYLGLEDAKELLKNHLSNTTLALSEAIHPSLESVNKQKFMKQLEQDQQDIVLGNGNVINDKAEFNFNNELIPTAEFVEELFNNRKAEFVGKFTEGKISESEFDRLKARTLESLNLKQVTEKVATLQAVQDTLEVENIAAAEENPAFDTREDVVVEDTLLEEEFIEFTGNVEEDSSIFFEDFDITQSPNVIITDDEFDSMIENESYTPQQLAFVKKAMYDIVTKMQSITGQDTVSFKDAMSQYYKYFKNKTVLQNNFRHFAKGWRENGYAVTNAEILAAFDSLFTVEQDVMSVEEGIQNLFEKTISTKPEIPYEDLEEKTEALQQEVAVTNIVTVNYDEENLPISETAIEEINTQRTLNIAPKVGFNAIAYEEVIENGVLTRKSVSSALNIKENDLIDFRDLINPDMYYSGTTLHVELADESLWSQINVSDGRDSKGNVKVTPFSKWVEEREKDNPDFRTSKEFNDKRPIFYTNEKGKRLAYVHDAEWYSPFNVANPYGDSNNPSAPTAEWLAYINEGKQATSELRESMANGLQTVTVERASNEGVFHKLLDEEPLLTLNESNPQSFITVQRGESLENLPEEFRNGQAVLLNKETDFDITKTNGHTWTIYRIGTMRNDKGDLVKTYRALPINRQVTMDQVDNVRWALAAYSAYSGNTLPAQYRMTKEQALNNYIKPIAKATGLNLTDPRDVMDYIKAYFQLSPNTVYALRRPNDKQVYTADSVVLYLRLLLEDNSRLNDPTIVDTLSQHTNSKLLKGSFKAVELSKQGVTPLMKDNKPVSYQEYLKDTLLINIKAFNVGTDAKPVYATSIQPIINVEYRSVEKAQPTLTQRIEAAAQEVIQEINQEKSVPLEEHIKFLGSIGIDLEAFEEDDSLIESTDKLANLFNLVGNLNVVQEKTLRQFIVHSIGEKIDFDYKTKVNREKISNEIKAEINLQLRPIRVTIKSLLDNIDPSMEKAGQLQDAYNSVLQSISTIQENFTTIFDKAFEDIKKQTQLTEIEEDDVINENEETMSEKDYTKDSIEESGKSKASYRLRRFLHKIPKYDAEGNVVTGFLGFTEYMTFNDVYNELTKVLALGSEVTSDYNTIIDKLKQSKFPFVGDILKKLDGADLQIKNEFTYNFVRHTLSSKFAMFENTKGVSLKIYDTNSNEIGRIIKSIWLNENKASNLYKPDGSFNPEYAQVLISEFESWDKDVANVDKAALRSWLEKIGMYMNTNTWNDMVSKGLFNSGTYYTFKELYSMNKGGIFLNVVKFLKEGIANPDNFTFSRGVNVFSDLGGVVNAIANIEANYNPQLIALTYRDSGKNISTQVPTKYVTDLVQELKRSVNGGNTLIEDLQSLSLSENSTILHLLATEPTFKGLMELSHVGLTAIKEYGTKPSKAGITDLSELDYDMLTLTGFQDRKIEKLPPGTKIDGVSMRMANMLFPTMSDKTAGLFLKTGVFDFMKDSDLLFNIEENNVTFEANLKELLFNHLVLPELKRIIKFHAEVKRTNIKNYDKAATIFHFLPILNTLKSDKGIRIIEELAALENYTIEQVITKYKDTFETAIEKVIKQEVEHKKEVWKEQTEVSGGGDVTSKMFDSTYFTEAGKSPSKQYEIAVYDYVLNSMLFNAEVFKVFAGDIANYSQDKLFKGEANIYDMKQDSKYVSINKQIGVNLGKRLALLIAPGNKLANSYNEMYNQIMLQDATDIAQNAEYLIKLYYGKTASKEALPLLEKYDKANSILNRHEQGEFFISPENLVKVTNMLAGLRDQLSKTYPEIAAYFDIESTDAQEYSTASEHIETLYRMGRLSDKDYQAILAKMTQTGTAAYLSKRELRLVLQPIKPVATGTYINKDWDVNRVVYIKSSSFPLLPQVTAGTKLDALRIKMEELESVTGRFTRASFQSANKVGATKNTVNPFDVNSLEKIKEYGTNDLDSTVLVLNRNNFRIQQDVPFKSDRKSDDKVSMGTQFFKLLFGDGIIEERDYMLNGQMVTGRQLYEHYNQAFSTIVDTKKRELFLDLGLSETGEVTNQAAFMSKLQALLTKEATDRGYSIKSLRGLKIEKLAAKAGFYYEFKTPLWLSSDSNRYESLLNSIITNRMMKHKMPGNGFVAGSESGLKLRENLKGIDQSKMIFLDSYNGKELKGAQAQDGTFTKAQVFVPSKFKNNDKELIDLFEGYTEGAGEGKYIMRNKEGKLTLKPGMIQDELLNMFGFRTPTSSHVSGASVEIAGFLPSEMGDLMIVPKNFTKQKGLDYDIDKESAYQLNHYTDESGIIQVLNEDHKKDALAKLQSIVDKFDLENLTLDRKANIRKEILDFAIKNKFTFLDEAAIEEWLVPEVSVKEKLYRKSLEFDRKLAENEFIRTHLAVFNNPNPKVQSKINQILSIDFAKEQADKFEALNEEGKKNARIQQYIAKDDSLSLLEAENKYNEESLNFSMLTYSYQKDKMSLGSIGKIAIGVYANYTTFNGLIQQSSSEQFIPLITEEGFTNKPLTIGRFTSTGTLGAERTLDGERTIAQVFAEKENTATDNEKEQVLGRIGVNEATINVDAHLTLRGFDKDENGNAISYLLLSQPSIKKLNEQRKSMKGILGDYRKDIDLINDLLFDLSDGRIMYYQGHPILADTLTTDMEQEPERYYPEGEKLTGTAMLDGIKLNGQDKDVQLQSLLIYLDVEKEARGISKIQKTINTNTLGKSMIESQLKYEGLKELGTNPHLVGAASLLGDFIMITEGSTQPEGYVTIGDFYVKPTTPQGQIVINGLYYGNTIYRDFFPYQESGINALVQEVLTAQGKTDLTETTLVENFETILEEVKKYIYSRKDNNIFSDNPREKRFELFKDTDTNTSISTYIKDLLKGEVTKYGKGIKALRNNTLIKSFTFETGKGDNEVSLIRYNNASTDNLDEESLYNAIPELILLDAPLPDRNGHTYSTKLLAEDLVSYAYLEGGIQEAIQFIKFIPVEYLETVGRYEDLSIFRDGQVVKERTFVPANRKLQAFNSKRNEDIDVFEKAFGFKEDGPSTFTKQFFQHNPDKAAKITFKKVTNYDKVNQTFRLKPGQLAIPPNFLAMRNAKTETDKYSLYEHMGNEVYKKVPLLGQMGMSEYDYRNDNAVSIRDTSVSISEPVIIAENLPTQSLEINKKTTIKGLLAQIANTEFSEPYNHITEAAKALQDMAKDKGLLVFDNRISGAGRAGKGTLNISLNPDMMVHMTDERIAMTFMHEFIHTISRNELDKYFDSTGTSLKTDMVIPAYVTDLFAVFSEFRKSVRPELDILLNKINQSKDNSLGMSYTEREKDLIYAGANIREFLAVSLTSPLFFEEMNKVEYKSSGKSIFQKLSDAVMKMLSSIFPGLTQGSVAYNAISQSLTFITEENKPLIKSDTIELDSIEGMAAVDSEPTFMGALDENSQLPDFNDMDFSEDTGPSDLGDLMIDNPEDLLTLPDCI